jgi:hypothetical protein
VRDLELRTITTPAPTSDETPLSFHNCTDALIEGVRITSQAVSLLQLTGTDSAHIVLSANDLSRVTTPTRFSDGCHISGHHHIALMALSESPGE